MKHLQDACPPDPRETCAEPPEEGACSKRYLLAAWLLCLLPLFFFAGSDPVSRTQEARVLETAREMVAGGPWLLPHCGGHLRLQKPPLCYWLTAAGFKVGGVNEWAGRAPTILATWLALGLCGHIGGALFGGRAGLITMAMMLASYGAFRFGRLAETDSVAMLGGIVATWGFWRAAAADQPRAKRWWNWTAGIGLAVALMSKGGPALFPVVFLLGFSAIERTPRHLWAFVRSGGAMLFIVLGLSWYAYLWETQTLKVVWRELQVVSEGEDHPAPFYFYTYSVLIVAAPWAAIVIAGIAESFRQCRGDRRVLGLLVWLGSCAIPLSMAGNKQLHYAMSLLPPVLLLGAWILEQSLQPEAPQRVRRVLPWLLGATIAISAVAAAALPLARWTVKQPTRSEDWLFAAAGALISLLAMTCLLRRLTLQSILIYSAGVALLFSWVFGTFGPSLRGPEIADTARQVAAVYGEGPYFMVDENANLTAIFAMRQLGQTGRAPAAISAWMERNPQGVVLLLGHKDSRSVPRGLVPERQFGEGDATIWKLARQK